MNKGKKLYEGKAKILYETKDKDLLINKATQFVGLHQADQGFVGLEKAPHLLLRLLPRKLEIPQKNLA